MRRIVCLSAFVLLASSFTVFARLGETEKQIAARYGEPVETLPDNKGVDKVLKYKTKAYIITVSYLQGVSVDEWLMKRGNTEDTDKIVFTKVEIEALMKAFAGTNQWQTSQVNRACCPNRCE
jgi:hypothetical protein